MKESLSAATRGQEFGRSRQWHFDPSTTATPRTPAAWHSGSEGGSTIRRTHPSAPFRTNTGRMRAFRLTNASGMFCNLQ